MNETTPVRRGYLERLERENAALRAALTLVLNDVETYHENTEQGGISAYGVNLPVATIRAARAALAAAGAGE